MPLAKHLLQNTLSEKLYAKTRHPFLFYILYSLFSLNDKTFKHQKTEITLWTLIKCELFYMGGQCQHSGQCCKKMMLFNHGKPVNTLNKFFDFTKKTPSFKRFIPKIIQFPFKEDAPISHFSCNCLTPNNYCNDYPNRPVLCQNYPASNFLTGGKLHDGCGYKIERTTLTPKIKNKRLQELIRQLTENSI